MDLDLQLVLQNVLKMCWRRGYQLNTISSGGGEAEAEAEAEAEKVREVSWEDWKSTLPDKESVRGHKVLTWSGATTPEGKPVVIGIALSGMTRNSELYEKGTTGILVRMLEELGALSLLERRVVGSDGKEIPIRRLDKAPEVLDALLQFIHPIIIYSGESGSAKSKEKDLAFREFIPYIDIFQAKLFTMDILEHKLQPEFTYLPKGSLEVREISKFYGGSRKAKKMAVSSPVARYFRAHPGDFFRTEKIGHIDYRLVSKR